MLVLVAGGPASGKATVCQELAELVKSEDCDISVKDVAMSKWHREPYGADVDFSGLKQYLEEQDPNTILLVHGKYALYDEEIRSKAAMKVFVDSDSDEQLSQWLLRDKDRREIHEIMDEYLNKARIEFSQHVVETKKYADVLLPRAKDSLGVQVISMNIVDRLRRVDDGSYPLRSAKKIDLRKELFEQLDGRYYAAT